MSGGTSISDNPDSQKVWAVWYSVSTFYQGKYVAVEVDVAVNNSLQHVR